MKQKIRELEESKNSFFRYEGLKLYLFWGGMVCKGCNYRGKPLWLQPFLRFCGKMMNEQYQIVIGKILPKRYRKLYKCFENFFRKRKNTASSGWFSCRGSTNSFGDEFDRSTRG
ncbi:TPA: hypothetical protein ACGOVB_001984 [Streptococcus suis]